MASWYFWRFYFCFFWCSLFHWHNYNTDFKLSLLQHQQWPVYFSFSTICSLFMVVNKILFFHDHHWHLHHNMYPLSLQPSLLRSSNWQFLCKSFAVNCHLALQLNLNDAKVESKRLHCGSSFSVSSSIFFGLTWDRCKNKWFFVRIMKAIYRTTV